MRPWLSNSPQPVMVEVAVTRATRLAFLIFMLRLLTAELSLAYRILVPEQRRRMSSAEEVSPQVGMPRSTPGCPRPDRRTRRRSVRRPRRRTPSSSGLTFPPPARHQAPGCLPRARFGPPGRAACPAVRLARIIIARRRVRGVPRVPRQQMLQPGQPAGRASLASISSEICTACAVICPAWRRTTTINSSRDISSGSATGRSNRTPVHHPVTDTPTAPTRHDTRG